MAAGISVQLYSVRDDIASDRPGTLHRLAALGFTHVEPFGLGNSGASAGVVRSYDDRIASAEALRRDLNDAGLAVSGVHAAIADDVEVLAAECAVLGVDTAFVPHPNQVSGFGSDPTGVFASESTVDAFAEKLGEHAIEAARHGIRLGYHNHEFEWAGLPDGSSGYRRFWAGTSAELAAEVDVYWAVVGGADPATELAFLGDRAIALHLKDGAAQRGEPQTPIGTGDVDIPAALAAAPAARWLVTEIDHTDHDPYDLLATNLRQLGG